MMSEEPLEASRGRRKSVGVVENAHDLGVSTTAVSGSSQ
jgi:hypothetical protein